MSLISRLVACWRNLFRKREVEQGLSDELASTFDALVERNIKEGLSEVEARRRAAIELGGLEQLKETIREAKAGYRIEGLMHDLRYAGRMLLKTPGFSVVAIATLALGIGANTAIFSVVNAVLLKPLPFPEPEQLVSVNTVDLRRTNLSNPVSFPNFSDLRALNHSFASLAVYRPANMAFTGQGPAQSLRTQHVSADFFNVLGIQPFLGRTFLPAEEKPDGGPDGLTTILSNALWKRQFTSDPTILGHKITLDGKRFTIVGVMPDSFQYPMKSDPTDLYVTSALDDFPTDGMTRMAEDRNCYSWSGLGRLQPDTTFAQAQSEVRTISAALEKQYQDSNAHLGMVIHPLRHELVGEVSNALYVLFAAVACVLLIAIANVANLLLARATVRGKEMALRSALGASRGRIIQQLLMESLVLSGCAGLLGFLLALWGINVLVAMIPQTIPRISTVRPDGIVLAFTLIVSMVTGIVFGLAPAARASKVDLRGSLNDCAQTTNVGASSRHGPRHFLIIGEIALALVLLVCAGLLLQSFTRLSRVDPGIYPDRLLTGLVSLPADSYPTPQKIIAYFDRLLPRLRELPGVTSVSSIFPLPLSGGDLACPFDIEGRSVPRAQQASCSLRIAATDYFHTMGISVRGRAFDKHDEFNSKPVAMVNEAFAQQYFPNEEVIGKRIQPAISAGPGGLPMREIVGVVGNVKNRSLGSPSSPEVYVSAAQVPFDSDYIVLRTATSQPGNLTDAVRAIVVQVDPGVPLTKQVVFDEYLSRSLARPRFNAVLISIFAALALLLTAIGIYGVIAYSVAQRRQEIGVRLALGAQKWDVLQLIVSGGMKLAALGIVIGLGASALLTRLLGDMLYAVKPFDAPTMAVVVFLVGLIAFLACWFPALKASRLNPIATLRNQ